MIVENLQSQCKILQFTVTCSFNVTEYKNNTVNAMGYLNIIYQNGTVADGVPYDDARLIDGCMER